MNSELEVRNQNGQTLEAEGDMRYNFNTDSIYYPGTVTSSTQSKHMMYEMYNIFDYYLHQPHLLLPVFGQYPVLTPAPLPINNS
jgi:hypothetical protein